MVTICLYFCVQYFFSAIGKNSAFRLWYLAFLPVDLLCRFWTLLLKVCPLPSSCEILTAISVISDCPFHCIKNLHQVLQESLECLTERKNKDISHNTMEITLMLAQPREIYNDFVNMYFMLFVELEPLL